METFKDVAAQLAAAVLAVLAVLAVFTLGAHEASASTVGAPPAMFQPLVTAAQHAHLSAGSPEQDAAACSAVEWFRHVDRSSLYLDEALWQQARHDAMAAAHLASPQLGHHIVRYLDTDRGYRRVVAECQAQTYGV